MMKDGKMSKSKGNVIYADDLVNEYGVDAVRYYFLHEIPFASDGLFTKELLVERINGDLANILGNLVQRTISMGKKYFDGKVANKKIYDSVDEEFINNINSLYDNVCKKMDNLQVSDSLTEIFNLLRASNKYIDVTTPWTLAKDEASKDRLETVLYNLLEAIRVSAVLLNPFFKLLKKPSQENAKLIGNLYDDDMDGDKKIVDDSVPFSWKFINLVNIPNNINWMEGYLRQKKYHKITIFLYHLRLILTFYKHNLFDLKQDVLRCLEIIFGKNSSEIN